MRGEPLPPGLGMPPMLNAAANVRVRLLRTPHIAHGLALRRQCVPIRLARIADRFHDTGGPVNRHTDEPT